MTGARSSRATNRSRMLFGALFVAYLAGLAWIVLWKLQVPHLEAGTTRQLKLLPYVATADAGASTPTEVLANVVLFIPFGVHLAVLAPSWRFPRAVATIAMSSLALEIAQYALALGITDVSDILSNTIGGTIGLFLVTLVRVAVPRRAGALRSPFVVSMALVLVAITLLAAQLPHQRPSGERLDAPQRHAALR